MGVWLFLAFRHAVEQIRYDRVINPHASFSHILRNTLSWYWMVAFLSPIVFILASKLEFRRRTVVKSLATLVAGFFLFLAIDSATRWLLYPVHHPVTGAVYPRTLRLLAGVFVEYLDHDLFIYLPIVTLAAAYRYYSQNRRREISQSKLEAELARARLHILKMQLHPHFLFNTLHAIARLVGQQPRIAREMIVSLSELLRIALDNETRDEVALREELEVLELYLAIERIRFAEQLEVSVHVDSAALGVPVPVLLLQPIVENAIKHGAGAIAEKGVVTIQCSVEHQRLRIKVRDNGPGMPQPGAETARNGLGLRNVRARLEQFYGRDFTLGWHNLDSGGVEIAIELPLEKPQLQSVLP